jgi:CRP-like cAMP-binding protein
VLPFEFIDSYEKIARGLKGKSQVTIRATEQCSIIRWDYKSLDSICRENPRLQHCIDAMVGQDLIRKFMRLAGRTYAGYDTTSDMLRKLDNPLSCVKKVGIKKAVSTQQTKSTEPDQKPEFDDIIKSLRYANSRMLGIQCTPLETLNPIAGEPEKCKHYDRLVSFLNRSVKLDDADAQEIIKWGKFRTIKLKGTHLIRQDETPYHLGVVMEGRLDVSKEDADARRQTWISCIDENELFGAEDFQLTSSKARQSIMTRNAGVVVFQWDSEQLKDLMQQDPRLNMIVHRLLLDDHAFKQVHNQSWTTRMCGPSLHAPVYDHRMC